jgi:hypothetical protein
MPVVKVTITTFFLYTNFKYNMGIKRWRIKGSNRVEQASIIKEAKVKLKGP